MREITALFTDIEGFTAMTERVGSAPTRRAARRYFDVAARIVTDHGGMIDKIVGDALHAIFNAPFALDDHPRHAVACALAMRELRRKRRRSPLGSGCGSAARASALRPDLPSWATSEAAASSTTPPMATR